MRSRAGKRAAWSLAAMLALACGVARAEGGPSALDLLRSASVAPTSEGLELSVTLTEAELGELARAAIEDYLRSNQPRLLSRLSLGMVRYRDARIVAKKVAVSPRPKRPNHLGLEVAGEVVATAQKREIQCEMDGWEPRCKTRWIDRGTAVLARLDASGELVLSLRRGATLAGRPVEADVLIDRVRGALAVGGLAELDLSVDLDPPYRARRMSLGLPPSAAALRERFDGLVVRRLRVAAAGKERVAITALIGSAER